MQRLPKVRGPVAKLYKQKLQNVQLEKGMSIQSFLEVIGVSDVGHRGASEQKAYAIVLTFDDIEHRDLFRHFLTRHNYWVLTDGSESPTKQRTTPPRTVNHDDLTGATGGIHMTFNPPTPSPQGAGAGYTTPNQKRNYTPNRRTPNTNSDQRKRNYQDYSASQNNVRCTTRECLQLDAKTKNLIIFTNPPTETLMREEKRLMKDQQSKNIRENTKIITVDS